jgi:xylose isomerase
VNDLARAHEDGMDSFARDLKDVRRLIDEGEIESIDRERRASWESGVAKSISDGDEDFSSLEPQVIDKPAIANIAGRQQRLEGIFNRAIFRLRRDDAGPARREVGGQKSHISSANAHLRRDPAD